MKNHLSQKASGVTASITHFLISQLQSSMKIEAHKEQLFHGSTDLLVQFI